MLWPGRYTLVIRFDDGEHERRVDPEMPIYVHNADTTQVHVWH